MGKPIPRYGVAQSQADGVLMSWVPLSQDTTDLGTPPPPQPEQDWGTPLPHTEKQSEY